MAIAGLVPADGLADAADTAGGSLVLEIEADEARMVGRDAAGHELLPDFPLRHGRVVAPGNAAGHHGVMAAEKKPIFVANLGEAGWHESFSGEIRHLTVAVWLLPPGGYDGENFLVLNRSGGADGQGTLRILMINNGQFYLACHSGPKYKGITGGTAAYVGSPLPVGEWTHLAMTFEEGVFQFFIDGYHVHTTDYKGPFLPSQGEMDPKKFRLSALSLPEGMVCRDLVFISGKALDPGEIEALAQEGLGALDLGPVE